MMQAKIWKVIGALAVSSLFCDSSLAQSASQGQGEYSGAHSSSRGDRSSRLTLKLRDRELRDVINNIKRRAGVNIILAESIDARVTIDLEDVEWRAALELVAEAAGCVVIEKAGNVLSVEQPPRVHFAFDNADVQQVIDTIAKISGANIVVAPEVSGTITLRLSNIPWRDALEATVKTLGYVVVEEDRGILRVVPPSNMLADLITRTFQLRFVRPKSAYLPFLDSEYVRFTDSTGGAQQSEFELIAALRRMVTPDVGSLDYYEAQNQIVIKDTKAVVEAVRQVIERIDIEPGQVFIDVKFVTTSNTDVLEYGISPGDNGYTASLSLGQIPTRLPFNLGSGGFDDSIIANDNRIGPFADELLNPTGLTTVPNVVFGALDFQQVRSTLRLLKRDVKSTISQAPKIIALDHHEATIFVGETVRYAQARSEQGQAGGFQLTVEEAPNSPVSIGFQLLVIPHIVPGSDKIIMDIIPKSDALVGTGSTALAPAGFDVFRVGAGDDEGSIALPRIASSTIATKVILQSGHTAVIGGLVTDSDTETVTKLPILGDIPLLGWLFKSRNVSKSKTVLIVFVTPQIIRSSEDAEANIRSILKDRHNLMQAEYDRIFGTGDEEEEGRSNR